METVLITGGSGLVGSRLSFFLKEKGYEVRHLSRSTKPNSKFKTFLWDLNKNYIDPSAIIDVDHVIHLTGTSVASRWTTSKKESILNSRIDSAKLLFGTFKNQTLKTYVSASGISYYGTKTSEQIFKEDDSPSSDFLADVTIQWEKSAELFNEIAKRVVCLRTPVVLSPNGGALDKMVKPIKMGFGSPLGSGNQYMPWIHVDDLCNTYINALENNNMTGNFNACTNQHVNNSEITHTIAKTLGKKLWLPNVPTFVLKLMLGEMADIILYGSRASNDKLLKTGFTFQYSDLEIALKDCLKK